jgi:glycosyltransferase involved in cell wall biosynthesis
MKYKHAHSFTRLLDFSATDLVKNRELMERFSNMKNIELKSINWFIPYFHHAYGGIYTILRFANYFHTKKGIKNRLIIYGNPLASETEIKNKIAKSFPNLLAEEIIILRDYDVNSLPYADICIATLWTSAYLVLKFNKTKGKFYFIQDYEPLFSPAGTIYALTENTYRFGFYGITNTPGLYDIYTQDYKGVAEYFVPSVDKKIFHPSERKHSKPSIKNPFTIFFYARPDTPRNAFELGIAALEEIKKKYGECVKIYTAGSEWNSRNYNLESVIDNLGRLSYEKTPFLYRKCDIGIVFMFTKHPSYLPFELMACGCVVLTNYNPATTWFLKDGFNCLLTEPSISRICEKIETLMNDLDLRKRITSNALNSIANTSWDNEIEKIYTFICKHEKITRSE